MAKVPMPERSGSSLDGPTNSDKKEVTKVTKGKVKTQEKSALKKFGEAFIEDDAKDIKAYVVSDVLIPAIKNLIFDSVIGSIEMALFGTASRSHHRNGGRNETTSYSSYYKSGNNSRRRDDDSRRSDRLDYQSIIFEERADADEVLDTLCNLIEDYGQATIGDFYDAAGVTPDNNFTKNEEYGWTDLRTATVKRGRDGYFISMPREKYLD
jgi:hypothetical protein